VLAAHRIRLAPNNAQTTHLARAAGTARFAFNWALTEWQKQYLARRDNPALPAPSQLSLRRQLNAIKRDRFPWMLEVTKNAPQMAIIQLGKAFENFFAKRGRYPQFRRKGRGWYPSSKLCSCCGHLLEALSLGMRDWTCPGCGARHDRDVNAAVNLQHIAASSAATACGGDGAGPARKRETKPAPAKQESNGTAALDNNG
jgi:putative transposase